MEKELIIELIREEIDSYQDIDAPERKALAILLTKIETTHKKHNRTNEKD